MYSTALQIVIDVLMSSIETAMDKRFEFHDIAGVLDALSMTSKGLNQIASSHTGFRAVVFFRRLMDNRIDKKKYWDGVPIRMRDDILESACSIETQYSLARAMAGWTSEVVWDWRISRANRAFGLKLNSLAALYREVIQAEAVCYVASISAFGGPKLNRCVYCDVPCPVSEVACTRSTEGEIVLTCQNWSALDLLMACMEWDDKSAINSFDNCQEFALSYWNEVLQKAPGLAGRRNRCSTGCDAMFRKAVVKDVNGNELSQIRLEAGKTSRRKRACGYAMMYQAKSHAFARNEHVRKVFSRAARRLRTSKYAVERMTYVLNVDVCILHAMATVANGVSPSLVQTFFASGDPGWKQSLSSRGIGYAGGVLTSGRVSQPGLICDSACNDVLANRVRRNSVRIVEKCLFGSHVME